MRWGMRGLGLISTIILARLLVPADFGLVAMAMAVIGIMQALTEMNISVALIRDPHAHEADFNAAWTLQILQMLVVAFAIFALSPLAADFYGDPRVTEVLRYLALSLAIRGFENIGVVEFQRRLDFARDFRFNVATKALSALVTISLAFHFRNYWALVAGQIAASVITVLLSYQLCAYRPRPNFVRLVQIWGFSKWILVRGFAAAIDQRFEVLLLGRLSVASNVGAYSIGSEISSMLAAEITGPTSRALMPGLAKLSDNPERRNHAFLMSFGAIGTVALPASAGISLVAPEMITVVFGNKWLATIPVLQVLAMFAGISVLANYTFSFLLNTGNERALAIVAYANTAILGLAVVAGYYLAGIVGVAFGRGAMTVFASVAMVFLLFRKHHITVGQIFGAIWRPALATVTMIGTLIAFGQIVQLEVLPSLIAKTAIGACMFVAMDIGLWCMAGYPEGLERMVANRMGNRLGQSNSPTS